MFRKRKVSDDPLTYKFFETLGENQDPLYLGKLTAIREAEDVFRWESAFGSNSGEGPAEVGMHMIQKCARESEAVIVIKTMGMH